MAWPFCVCRTLYCTARDGSSAAEYLGLILALLSVPLVLEFVSVVPESVLHNLAIFEEASACTKRTSRLFDEMRARACAAV